MIAAHLNPKTVCRFRQSWSPSHLARILFFTVSLHLAVGCQMPRLNDLQGGDEIQVRLDSNSRAHMPGRKIKFFVDLVNQTSSEVDVSVLDVELRASPHGDPDTISLRHRWRYDWKINNLPSLRPKKRMTIPVVPEKGVEFPLEILHAGDYDIVAVVNGRFSSQPYPLAVVRPDIKAYRLDSTISGPHRTFEEQRGDPDAPDRIRERSPIQWRRGERS